MSASNPAVLHDSTLELPAWKSIVSHVAAVAVAIIFIGAGLGKIVVPYLVQQLFEQLLVPAWASMPLVVALGILETTGGVLVLIPRYRRIGAGLITLLLLVFIGYVGIRYQALVGRDCSCFPWLKRTVNPAFFAEDGAMLACSLIAGWFAHKATSLRLPIIALAVVAGVSASSFTYNMMQQTGVQVPATITVDGKPYNLREGRVFLFFFDPQCSHCEEAAEHMSTYKWKSDVTPIALPTQQPQWAEGFLHDTKFKARVSLDTEQLRKLFVFTSPPYGVSVVNGRVKGIVSHYDPPQPEAELRALGLIE